MHKILLIKLGDTFPELKCAKGDFEEMISACLQDEGKQFTLEVFDARKDLALSGLENISGVILTGSHSMVTACEPWSERLIPYIKAMQLRNLPVLGICYGHQLIAKALGGEVDFHPLGPEPGTVNVCLTAAGKKDKLLGTLPDIFSVNVAHSQSVISLPENAVLLAMNHFEPHQAFRIGNIWGIQFHPEFDQAITQYYVDEIAAEIEKYAGDPEKIRDACKDTEYSRSLLGKFTKLCSTELK
jgi:GMP synthase (glutamine-hydrolysing)